MKIVLMLTGKTSSVEIKNICDDYIGRINRYAKMEEVIVESRGVKTSDSGKMKEMESELLMKKLSSSDYVILLDAAGKEFSSEQFATHLQSIFNQGRKNICFIVGGAYGFSDALYKRADAKISLSKMTFSHQIIRPLFLEQLYRAFTIIHHEPYHHG